MKHVADLAALDQLESALEHNPDSQYFPLISRYCELAKQAIVLRQNLHIFSAERCKTEVWPILDELNEILKKIDNEEDLSIGD